MIQTFNIIVPAHGEGLFGIIRVLILTPLEYLDLEDGEKALIGELLEVLRGLLLKLNSW